MEESLVDSLSDDVTMSREEYDNFVANHDAQIELMQQEIKNLNDYQVVINKHGYFLIKLKNAIEINLTKPKLQS